MAGSNGSGGAVARVWHAHDTVECQKKIFAIAPTFELFDDQGNALLFCKEKLFAIKDDIRIYSDSSKQTELLRIKQRNILDFAGVFDIVDSSTDQKIGVLRRKGFRSFIRDEWHLLDANDQQIGSILETGGYVWRRIFKFLPYWFAFLLGDREVGTFTQQFSLFRYRATMDLAASRATDFDRRLAFAGALLLMAVEAKEDKR